MAPDSMSGELDRIQNEYARRAREVKHHSIQDYYHAQLKGAVRQTVGDLSGRSVLDIGCGDGTWLMVFRELGAHKLAGIELRPEGCAAAMRNVPDAEIVCGSAHRLPWPDASFDIVSQFVVFTSVLDLELKRQMASEMLRVLKPSGAIFWYDFRVDNPRNCNVRGVGQPEIQALFKGCSIDLHSVILAPPLASLLVPRFPKLAATLEKVPFLRSHYLGLIRQFGTDYAPRKAIVWQPVGSPLTGTKPRSHSRLATAADQNVVPLILNSSFVKNK